MLQRAGCIVQQRQKPCQLWGYLHKPWTDPLVFPGTDAGSDRAPFRLHRFLKAGQVIHWIVDKRPHAHCYLSLSPTAPGGSWCSKSITCLLAKSNILPLEGNRCYFVFSSFESAHNALHPKITGGFSQTEHHVWTRMMRSCIFWLRELFCLPDVMGMYASQRAEEVSSSGPLPLICPDLKTHWKGGHSMLNMRSNEPFMNNMWKLDNTFNNIWLAWMNSMNQFWVY